jgi:hypothetical protein
VLETGNVGEELGVGFAKKLKVEGEWMFTRDTHKHTHTHPSSILTQVKLLWQGAQCCSLDVTGKILKHAALQTELPSYLSGIIKKNSKQMALT